MVDFLESGRKENVTSVFKKEDPGIYRLVSFILILGKVIEQLILEIVSRHVKSKKVTGSNQHGFMKRKNMPYQADSLLQTGD